MVSEQKKYIVERKIKWNVVVDVNNWLPEWIGYGQDGVNFGYGCMKVKLDLDRMITVSIPHGFKQFFGSLIASS